MWYCKNCKRRWNSLDKEIPEKCPKCHSKRIGIVVYNIGGKWWDGERWKK